MPSIRELYLQSLKIKNDHVSEFGIRDILIHINRLKNYTDFTLHMDDEIIDENLFNSMFERLQKGEMLEYILGEAEFLGRRFHVNKNVLIPRNETEELYRVTNELVKMHFKSTNLNVADACTGSGVLGINFKIDNPNSSVTVTDISPEALDVCNENIDLYKQNIRVLRGNFIEPLIETKEKFDVILCNPPYIEKEEEIDSRTWDQEPHLALLAKPGTMFYEILIKNISKIMNDKFLIAFEIGEDLKSRLEIILKNNGLDGCYTFKKDIYQRDRFLFIMK